MCLFISVFVEKVEKKDQHLTKSSQGLAMVSVELKGQDVKES